MAKRTVKKKKSRKVSRTSVIFWICLALLLIPCGIFGWTLISASLDGGAPVLGDRYKDDLNPAITKSELESVKKAAECVSGVQKVDVELATATLRVYADIADDASNDTALAMADSVYGAVTGVLDPATYFSQHDGMKMYDLEVWAYNSEKAAGTDDYVCVIRTKTSSMEEAASQIVSEPVNAELAQQLRDAEYARNNPTPTPEENTDITVGGEDIENQ